MKKKDLKTGMVAETEDGELRIVWGNTLVSYDAGGAFLVDFNDDLERDDNGPSGDVIKVYSRPNKTSGLRGSMNLWLQNKEILNYVDLLWERKEEKPILKLDGVEYSESTLRSLIKKATNS